MAVVGDGQMAWQRKREQKKNYAMGTKIRKNPSTDLEKKKKYKIERRIGKKAHSAHIEDIDIREEATLKKSLTAHQLSSFFDGFRETTTTT